MGDVAVAFHELSFVPEGDEVVVGRVDADSYAVLPADGAALLREMARGMSPERAGHWYEENFGEPVDIAEFLETLHDLGFVRTSDAPAQTGEGSWRLLPRWLGRAAFSPPAWIAYAALFVLAVLAIAGDPVLAPDPAHIFFTDSLLLVQFGIIFGQLPLIFAHEAFHTLAGRRLGLSSRLGVSNRYLYVVFETHMNGLWSVPRAKRYLPFLAGMACDVVVYAILVLIAQATSGGEWSLIGRIALALAFTVVMRFAWQFQLFLRTDLYYVFATALNCHNLHEAGTTLLRNRLWRLLGRTSRLVDEQQWTEHDRRVGRWYGPFIVLGVTVWLLIAVLGSLPVVLQYVRTAADGMRQGPLEPAFWDGLLGLVILAVMFLPPAYLAWRKRRRPTTTEEVS